MAEPRPSTYDFHMLDIISRGAQASVYESICLTKL